MQQSRLEWKVGGFVFISLIVMAALVIKFSKGSSVFASTYEIRMKTNSHPLSASVSNLVVFSDLLNQTAKELHLTVSTNRADLNAIIKNVESASTAVDRMVNDLQAGKGLAGHLLKDERIEQEFSETVSNLSLLSSNLNRFGLLWKPRAKKPVSTATTPALGRKAF